MWAKLGQYAINKLIIYFGELLLKWGPIIVKEWILKKKRDVDQAAAKVEHDKIVANPESTPEEIADAYKKMRNSGK